MLSVRSKSSRSSSSRGLSPNAAPRRRRARLSPPLSPSLAPHHSPTMSPRDAPSSTRNLMSQLPHLQPRRGPKHRDFTFRTGTTAATQNASNKEDLESKSSVEILDQSFMSGITSEDEKGLSDIRRPEQMKQWNAD